MVRFEQAIYDLWMARDDSHIAAWRDAGLEGPPLQLLTLLWSGEAATMSDLTEKLREDQAPDDVEANMAYLMERGYVTREDNTLALTPEGALTREDIERETDRIYFTPWPHSTEEAAWMRDRLSELIENLPGVKG
jgi:DNA-binding MarR family transcriptional regulator